jgi:hypothetical protein
VPAVADIHMPQAMPGEDPAPAAAMVVIRVVSVPVVPVTEVPVTVAVKPVKAVTVEVAATKAAEGDPVATEAMETTKAVATETMEATEAMATTSKPVAATTSKPVAAATAATTSAAGIGDLRQRDDHGDQQGKHQIKQLTTHDTHSFCRRSSPSTFAINVLG